MPSEISAGRAAPASATLRAMAHPTRLEIMELLRRNVALTATECAKLLDLSPKICSYHLQMLAAGGYVEEVPAAGRIRPWRLIRDVAPAGPAAPATTSADNPLGHARDRSLRARVRRDESLLGDAMEAIAAAAATTEWATAVTVHTRVTRMSAEELAAWVEDVERLTRRHVRRPSAPPADGGGDGRHDVHLLFYGFPRTPA